MKHAKTIALWIVSIIAAAILFVWPFDGHVPVPAQRTARRATPIADKLSAEEASAGRRAVVERLDELLQIWKKTNPDEMPGEFNSGASEEDIRLIEHRTGEPLPPGFRAYLEKYDGQRSDVFGGGIYSYHPWLSAEQIAAENDFVLFDGGFVETTGLPMPVHDFWWHPRLVSFAQSDGAGYAVDSETGEVLRWDHDGGSLSRTHDSLLEMLDTVIQGLKNGREIHYWDYEGNSGGGRP